MRHPQSDIVPANVQSWPLTQAEQLPEPRDLTNQKSVFGVLTNQNLTRCLQHGWREPLHEVGQQPGAGQSPASEHPPSCDQLEVSD